MKTSKLAIIAVISLAILAQTCIQAKSQNNVEITISRLIDAQQSYLLIRDEVTVLQSGLNNLTFYLPIEYKDRIYAIKALDEAGEQLQVEFYSKVNYTCLNVKLPKQPTPFKVEIEIYMINHFSSAGGGFINLTIPLYPILPIEAKSCSVEVLLPPGSKIIDAVHPNATFEFVNGRYTANYAQSPLKAMNETMLTVIFSATIQQIQCLKVVREVKVNGELDVLDTVTIRNAGFTWVLRAEGVNFTLPADASIESIEDDFGNLAFETYENGEAKVVNVKLRYYLKTNWKYKLYIHYKLPSKGWIEEHGNKELAVPLNPFYNFPIDELEVLVYLPPGSNLISTQGLEPTTSDSTVRYSARNVVGDNYPQNVKIEYTPPPPRIEIPTSTITVILIGALIGAAVYVKRYVLKREFKRPAIAAKPEIEELYDAYMSKIDVLIDMKNLEESYRKGRIMKKAYKARMSSLREELRKVSSEVNQLKNKVAALNSKLKIIINEIEAADSEFSAIIKRVRELERSYMSKRLTRREYEERKRKLEKDLRKARLKLERKLADLLELTS
ncbi:MAG: hypothetical protein DRJ20_00145 [Candidatus Methanomethylicota archaeon]|uniref:Uncharacterized protein n=1 Tax=Thermoproteota archaeon TaxID=2056631 RepID=A0A497F0H2_9CREN|nr:MAG: hypothetical protein DRJ20_00145 [Candidatus Verstraetearchaeota archaeon]